MKYLKCLILCLIIMFVGCASDEYNAQTRLLKLKTENKEVHILPGSVAIFFIIDQDGQAHYIDFGDNPVFKSDTLKSYNKKMDYIIPYSQKIK